MEMKPEPIANNIHNKQTGTKEIYLKECLLMLHHSQNDTTVSSFPYKL